ncbi:MAG: acetyl-CoA carboxylase biotin carboxylase subunit [Chitinophagaceae bacterium]
MFKKILIANRGEIALRIIQTCKELNIRTVAVYSTADSQSLHVKYADEAVCIGQLTALESYLNIPHLISAAVIMNADAIHPGYGFLAENQEFAGICAKNKIKFIGPTPNQIGLMGDKITAKKTMIKAQVPTIPGSDGLIKDTKHASKIAQEIGYPVILKATAGGGGRGMRVVYNEKDLEDAFNIAKVEASSAFKNDGVYMEKFLEDPRHIEIQIIGDSKGNVSHLSERDCSIQRRHQKLIEECPSPFMTPELRRQMGEAAIKAAKSIKYESTGTVEFLVDKHRNFYFMEMNTRIQVEHCVTEEVIGFDLIKEQILVALGETITGKNYDPERHALECRINAEDPYHDFRPSPGKITYLHQPGGRNIRIDSHIYTGYTIPYNYDSLIAKLIAFGRTREETISIMQRALSEFVVEGIKTTIPFHQQLLQNEQFRKGNFTTKFLETFKMQ